MAFLEVNNSFGMTVKLEKRDNDTLVVYTMIEKTGRKFSL